MELLYFGLNLPSVPRVGFCPFKVSEITWHWDSGLFKLETKKVREHKVSWKSPEKRETKRLLRL